MVGGRLQCLGSNQHLKAKFGEGYELEARLAFPETQTIAMTATQMQLPDKVILQQLQSICEQLGKPERVAQVVEGCEEGQAMFEHMSKEGAAPAVVFAEWWLQEDRATALINFLTERFPGTLALERHGRMLRFRLPTRCSLAEVFRQLEAARPQLHIEEY